MLDIASLPTVLYSASQALMATASASLLAAHFFAVYSVNTGRAEPDDYPWLSSRGDSVAH